MGGADRPRWGRTTLRAGAAGLVGWFGLTWRSVNIDDVGATWADAARETWPVVLVFPAVILGAAWLIPAFNRRFPKRDD